MNIFRNTFYTSLSKRLLIALLTIGMAGHLTGCAMGGSSDESATAGDETFAEESSGDFAEGEEGAPADGEEASSESVAEGEEAAPAEGDDLAEEVADAGEEVADAGEETKPADDAAAEDDLALEGEEGADDVAANEEDELSLDDELPSDIASNSTTEPAPIIDEPAPAPTDAPVFADQPAEAPSDAVAAAPTEPAAWVPLKKMKTEAFMAGSTNLNRVYVARPGDTKQSVAEKLYGDKSRAKDLSKWNGFLARGVKTGDKIYYASPSNPTDTNMLTYYEEAGVPAQTYVSRDGDNIRDVSKNLLGDKDSWKEVWATNMDVESKGAIPPGLNIRYWPEGSAPAAPVMAQTSPETANPADPMSNPNGAPPVDPLAQQQPPAADPLAQPTADPLAPNDPVAQAAMNPPPMNDPLAAPTGTPASVPPTMGSTEPPPPPPPAEPPAAVEPPAKQNHAATDPGMGAQGTEEADNMMMMGLGGIVLLAAGAVFFLMRRSRSRKVDLTQTTQVG